MIDRSIVHIHMDFFGGVMLRLTTEAAAGGGLSKKLFLKNFLIPSSLQLYLKESSAQVLSCGYSEIFKNTCFEEYL